MVTRRTTVGIAAAAAVLLAASGPAVAGQAHGRTHRHDSSGGELRTVLGGLDGPRGIDVVGRGMTLVTETDGTFSLILEPRRHWGRWHGARHGSRAVRIELGRVPATFAPAIAAGRHGTVWLLTGGAGPDEPAADGAARLYRWRPGSAAPVEVADIGAYQQTDPDPDDLEGVPADTNPFGLAALPDGGVLVADAAGNDLLRVSRSGDISTVARLKPRTVEIPEGLPGAGTTTRSEAVATSVTVGPDGAWYVGELRGFPATPGTSQIWRIRPGSHDAVCDPDHPWGACSRYADGLTSIVDLGAGPRGIYAVTLSKMSWLAVEGDTPAPGSEIGGLYLVQGHRHHGHHGHRPGSGRSGRAAHITELVPGQLRLPGGVDVGGRTPYVVGPVFGPGALMKVG